MTRPGISLVIALTFLSLLDALCTLHEIRLGLGEGNPAWAALIDSSPEMFVFLKLLVVSSLAWFLARRGKTGTIALGATTWVYSLVCCYHLLLHTVASPEQCALMLQ